jgi:hypothetical protein
MLSHQWIQWICVHCSLPYLLFGLRVLQWGISSPTFPPVCSQVGIPVGSPVTSQLYGLPLISPAGSPVGYARGVLDDSPTGSSIGSPADP